MSDSLTSQCHHDDADSLLAVALDSIQALELSVAEKQIRRALELFPDDGRFWELLGTVLWTEGKQDEALSSIETASIYRTLGPFTQLILADCYSRAGKTELSLLVLEFLTQEGRCPIEVLPQLAASLGSIQAYELAFRVCEQLIERDPDHHAAYFGLAYYLLKLGNTVEEALPFLTRAFELQPDSLTYRVNYGLALADLGTMEEASTILKPVHPQRICCCTWLAKLSRFFASEGDSLRADLFAHRIEELQGEHSCN